MTTSTISSIKAEVFAIANRYEFDVDIYFIQGVGDKRFKATWEAALVLARKFDADYKAAEAADKDETKALTSETEQAIVDVEVTGEGEMIILNKQELAVTLTNEIALNNGFSLWFDSEKRTDGFCVGNNTYSYQVPNIGVLEQKLTINSYATCVEAVDMFFTQCENLINKNIYDCDGIGGWLETSTDTLYLDPVRHIADLGDALELAQENEELAIYALQSGICYSVFGSHNKIDDTKYHIDGEPSEISDNFLWYRVYDSETEAVVGYVAQG